MKTIPLVFALISSLSFAQEKDDWKPIFPEDQTVNNQPVAKKTVKKKKVTESYVIKKGSKGAAVEKLQDELISLGYLKLETKGSFDVETEDAVKKYQKDRGYVVDGLVGEQLIYALSLNEEKRKELQQQAEKLFAEKIDPTKAKQIIVNVPSFTLKAYSYGKLVLESAVIIGKPSRKTPIFETNVTGIKFHPTWSPPPSILKKDILPTLGTERSFAASHGLHISYDGVTIDESEITDEIRYSGKLRFIQSPGDDNALGVLKFETDNDQNIYLHDTNSRKLFEKSQRALSSGGVRVQEWRKLAAWVQDLTEDGIDKKLSKQGTRIEKTENVPVSIIYSQADKKGEQWSFYPDIYNRNRT